MTDRFDDRFQALLTAGTPFELQHHLEAFAERLEFEYLAATWVVDSPSGDAQFHGVRKIPIGFLEAYADTAKGRRDPVMQHCRRSGVPLAWDRSFYVDRGESAMWEEQADHGLRAGIIVATHLPGDRHFILGFDRKASLSSPTRTTEELAQLTLISAFAQQAAMKILEPAPPVEGHPPLSTRELETLKWASAGKTAWETGRLLAISERTVVKHLSNAASKLGCVRKQQAVAKALRLRLLT